MQIQTLYAVRSLGGRVQDSGSCEHLLSLIFEVYSLLFTLYWGLYISDTTDASNAETDTDY